MIHMTYMRDIKTKYKFMDEKEHCSRSDKSYASFLLHTEKYLVVFLNWS